MKLYIRNEDEQDKFPSAHIAWNPEDCVIDTVNFGSDQQLAGSLLDVVVSVLGPETVLDLLTNHPPEFSDGPSIAYIERTVDVTDTGVKRVPFAPRPAGPQNPRDKQ